MKTRKNWIIFVGIAFMLFFLLTFLRNEKGKKEWIKAEILGKITDMAIKKNDKYTFFKLDSTWIWVGTRNPIFEKVCYIDYYFRKNAGEELIWLKKDLDSNDSISFWVSGADTISKKTEIYWIEKQRLIWKKK